MAALTEGKHTGEYIISEGNLSISREQGRLASGNKLVAGTVLGQVTSAQAITAGSNTGNGVAGAVTVGTQIINGTYTLTCIDATTSGSEVFSVVTPLGDALADLTVAVAYTSSHINLTIADGSSDFIKGDSFTVDAILGEYGVFNAGASDGTQTAAAILYSAVDATSAEKDCVVTARLTEVNEAKLTWKTGTTEVQKATALASLATKNIIARTGE